MNSLLSIINKYGKDGIINNVPQAELMEALMEISNSSQKVSRKSKKPHDPNAPKRPTSGYMFWLNENRTHIKETYFNDFEQIDDWSIKFKTEYYLFRFFSIYFSIAIVIEGVSGVGALISILKPAASEASIVEFP